MSPSLQPLILPRSFHINQYICSSCIRSPQRQWKFRRAVSTAAQILKDEDPKPQDFTPKPLSRPIGVLYPPRPGENSGIDPRSWRERRDDLFDYNKHLVRRKELYAPIPYVNPFCTVDLCHTIMISLQSSPMIDFICLLAIPEPNKPRNPISATGPAPNTIKAKPSSHPLESSVPTSPSISPTWWARRLLHRPRAPTPPPYYRIASLWLVYTPGDGRNYRRRASPMGNVIPNCRHCCSRKGHKMDHRCRKWKSTSNRIG